MQQSLEETMENSQSNDVVKVNAEYNHKTKHNDILYVIVLCMLFIIMATFFIFVFVQKKVRRKFDSDTELILLIKILMTGKKNFRSWCI